tara:strand:- start:17446 stop:17709 length:264 start_codon:yes stop_codon:yes gene_type:complete
MIKNKWMIKNSKNKRDAMLTFAVLGFLVVLAKFILSGISLTVNGTNVDFGILDATLVASILTPTLGAYVMRRHTDRKHSGDDVELPD